MTPDFTICPILSSICRALYMLNNALLPSCIYLSPIFQDLRGKDINFAQECLISLELSMLLHNSACKEQRTLPLLDCTGIVSQDWQQMPTVWTISLTFPFPMIRREEGLTFGSWFGGNRSSWWGVHSGCTGGNMWLVSLTSQWIRKKKTQAGSVGQAVTPKVPLLVTYLLQACLLPKVLQLPPATRPAGNHTFLWGTFRFQTIT